MGEFTPLSALFGGAIIGVSAVALMYLNGRIAGISGITAGLLLIRAFGVEQGWRLAFVVGLILAPVLGAVAGLGRPEISFVASLPTMVIAGFLVGFGTVLGNGCTSGHGVCGIARLSPRSIVATGVFMGTAALTVFLVRHVVGGSA